MESQEVMSKAQMKRVKHDKQAVAELMKSKSNDDIIAVVRDMVDESKPLIANSLYKFYTTKYR